MNQNNLSGDKRERISGLNKDFDLDIALTVLRKNWLVFPLLIIIGLSISYIYLRYTKPTYESTAVIQRSSQDEGKRILDIDNFEQEENLSEDIELLRSTFLLERALKNLNLNISYFSEGDILTEEKYLLSSYHVTLLELKDSTLLGHRIQVTNGGEGINLSFNANGKNEKIEVKPGEPVNNDYFHLIFKINNQEQFEQSVNENSLYFVFNDYATLAGKLHPSLNVYALNQEAKTIEISFESNNPRLATDVVSSVINTFFQYDLEKKSKSSASILEFIDSQLDTVFVQLKESEIAIQSFKDSSKVSDPELFTSRIMDQITELQHQLLVVDLDWELIQEVEQSVTKNDRVEIYNVIPAVMGTAYENLLVDELEGIHQLLIEKEDLSYDFTDKNEQVKRINKNIDSKTKNVFRVITSVENQLRFRRNSLENRINNLQSKLYGVPAKEMELARLNRMFNLNEKYYTLLIEKKTQYAISKAGYTMDNMVLQSPTTAILISPKRDMIYTASVVLSFMLSAIFLLIRYITFSDIHNPDELKKLLPSTVGFLGIVPKVEMESKNSILFVHQKPKSALAESYRHIRSNLQFILDDNKSNVIAVSSSISGEGKTFVALNMGGIFTMSGKNVLVIDLDLRKPKVHHGFNGENKTGMSSILAGKADWRDCVQTSAIEGLDYITAGPIPPNPSELIISGKLEHILEEFKGNYDLIIIDNPPVGIVSDGISVLNKADCPVYVFRSNYSKRVFAQRVAELVDTKKVQKLFVVLNGMELKRKGYGYGYGYGYGEYYSDEGASKKRWFRRRK